ncbi:MAG: hypothetical protein ACOC1X_04875 [Promethearchaeota archaeon]
MDVIEFEYRNPSIKDYQYLDWHRVYIMAKDVKEKPYYNDDIVLYIIKVWKTINYDSTEDRIDYMVKKYNQPYLSNNEWGNIGRSGEIYNKLLEKLAWKNIDEY